MEERFNFKKYFTRGFIGVFSVNSLNVLFQLIVSIILARLLGAAKYGVYAYVMVWINILALFCSLGLSGLSVREVSVYHSSADWAHLKGYLVRSTQGILFVSVCVIFVLGTLLFFFSSHFSSAKTHALYIGILALPFLSFALLRRAILQAFKKPIVALLPEKILMPAIFLVFVFVFFVLSKGMLTPWFAVLLRVMAIFFAILVSLYSLWKCLPKEIMKCSSKYKTKLWLFSAIPFLCLAGIMLFNVRVDIVILGVLRPDKDVGIYRVVMAVSQLVGFALTAYYGVIGPIIAQLFHNNQRKKLQRVVVMGSRFLLVLSLPVVLFILFLGRWLLGFVYGAEFGLFGYFPLAILSIAQLIAVSCGAVAGVLNLTHHEKFTLWITIISVVVNIVLNFALIPFLGMVGSAISSAISMVMWNLLLLAVAIKKVGINTFAFCRLPK